MKLNIINPPKKRRRTAGRKTRPVPKKRRKRSAKKTTRRRRTNNPPRRYHPKRRRTRRRNPSLLGLGKEFGDFLPRLAGKLVVAWVVRRYGTSGSLFGGAPTTSQTAGTSWTLGQYLLAYLAAVYGSKLFGRVLDSGKFREGAMDLILTKFVWTEGIARSDWARQQFGAPQVRWSPQTGQSWLAQGGQWSAMQGGMGDALVEQSPLDGLVEATPLDGTGGSSYGHLVAEETLTPKRRKNARYTGSAFTSNYNAAYAF